MKNYTLTSLFKFASFLILIVFISNCKKDCKVVNADYSPQFLDHAGMAPERVQFTGNDGSADNYSWDIEGVTVEGNNQIVTFDVSGLYNTSLIASKGNDQCSQSAVVEITPYPSVGSQRAISYFEDVGSSSSLIAKVIDTPSEIYPAIPDLPEAGGGMDVDNDGKKIFASPNILLASCYPNNEDLQVIIPPDIGDLCDFFDLTLDPDNNRVYFTFSESNIFSIKSTEMYNGSSNIVEIHSENIVADFFYITNDRKDNVLYWVEKGGTTVKRIVQNGQSEDFLTLQGGVFGDIEYDDTNNRIYFVAKAGNNSFIQSIKATDFSGEVVEVGPINGDIPFIYVDEDRQELFWAEDAQNTISSKQVGIQGTTVHVDNLGPVKGLTVGFYGD